MGVNQTRGALGNGRIGAIMKSLGKPGQVRRHWRAPRPSDFASSAGV